MKYIFLVLSLLFVSGCRESNSSTVDTSANERVVVLVHGLNSGSSTWKDMVSKISKVVGSATASSVEIGMNISINQGAKCWDAFRTNELLSCTKLSEITSQSIFRKSQATETIFGLDKGNFTVSSIAWKSRGSSSKEALVKVEEKKSSFENERVFMVNMSNNNQLTYDAQGYQLGKAIDDIAKITGIKNFTLIGHSMGGLAIRAYVQNEKTQHIEKIITIDTPHLGGKTYATLGAGFYLGGKNASVNLASDSKALAELNDMENIAGKYEDIEVYHLGYSDGLNGLDILKQGTYYDESDGIVDISSQLGPDSIEAHKVIFSPITRNSIKAYEDVLTGDIKEADEVIKSTNYGIVDLHLDFTLAHTMVLKDKAYIAYILKVLENK